MHDGDPIVAVILEWLTMLCRFVSTHSKVAEQQVIRTFVTAPIHFGCDSWIRSRFKSKVLSRPASSRRMSD